MTPHQVHPLLRRLENHLKTLPDDTYRDVLFHDFQQLIKELYRAQATQKQTIQKKTDANSSTF